MRIVVIVLAVFLGFQSFGQEKNKKVITTSIQTSAECQTCKETLEGKLNYTKGVKYAELNLEDMKLEVKFRNDKISKEEIKKIISSLGYDADDVKADAEAYKELPACCKVGGMEHEK